MVLKLAQKMKNWLQVRAIRATLLKELAHSSEGYPIPASLPCGLGRV
jgi:hypothetical protein